MFVKELSSNINILDKPVCAPSHSESVDLRKKKKKKIKPDLISHNYGAGSLFFACISFFVVFGCGFLQQVSLVPWLSSKVSGEKGLYKGRCKSFAY